MSLFLIYALHHPESLHVYVGKTCRGLRRRLGEHLRPSTRKREQTSRQPLYKWIKKRTDLGQEPEAVILEECVSKEALIEAEVFHIANFRALGIALLNSTDGGEGAAGRKDTPTQAQNRKRAARNISDETRALLSRVHSNPSIETRAKMSAAKQNMSAETREKISVARKGTKASEITKAKISAALIGRPVSDSTRKLMGDKSRGRVKLPSTLAKMSAAAKGKSPSAETRAKLSAAHVPHPCRMETRAKISAAHRARIAIFGTRKHTAETKEKIALSWKSRKQKTKPESDQ